jgi:hypothetical protein
MYYSLISSMNKTPSVDADALLFITNAVITNTTQQSAINTLVTDLKIANIWTKMKAIYPMVGGTASTHKWNLKDPRDLNIAYRLLFINGWTHSATGALPSGTDGHADTNLSALTVSTTNHLSYYSRTTSVGATCELGCYDSTTTTANQLRAGGNYISGSIALPLLFTSTTDGKGFWVGSKRAINDREIYKNSTSEVTSTTLEATNNPNKIIFLGARNENAGANLFSNKECAFASIGDGLTDAEEANFYIAVQKFNTTLGRQV